MIHIVVVLFLQHGIAVEYILPKEYGYRDACEDAIDYFKETWKTKKGIEVIYKCKRFLSV